MSWMELDPDLGVRSTSRQTVLNTAPITYTCIPDRRVIPRARASLPRVLELTSGGVRTRRRLPPNTRFGPVQGVRQEVSAGEALRLSQSASSEKQVLFLLKGTDRRATVHIDVSDETSPVFAETPLTFESALLPDVMKPLHEGSVHQQDTSQLIPEQVENNIPELGDFLRSLSAPHEPGNTREPPPSAWERVSASKLDIIAISLLVQVVFSVFSLSAETASIFLPLLVYVVTKLVMLPRRGQGGLVNAVLVMNGVAPDKVQTIMLVSHLLSTFMQDVFIYLFVIVCVQSLFVYFFVKNIPQAL